MNKICEQSEIVNQNTKNFINQNEIENVFHFVQASMCYTEN